MQFIFGSAGGENLCQSVISLDVGLASEIEQIAVACLNFSLHESKGVLIVGVIGRLESKFKRFGNGLVFAIRVVWKDKRNAVLMSLLKRCDQRLFLLKIDQKKERLSLLPELVGGVDKVLHFALNINQIKRIIASFVSKACYCFDSQ